MLPVSKANTKISVIFLFLGLLLITEGAALSQALFRGVITSPKINIRKNPDLESEVVGVADKGEAVDVLEKQGNIGGWLLVEYKGVKGYIRNRPKYIELTEVIENQTSKPAEEKTQKIQKAEEKKNGENPDGISPDKKLAIKADMEAQKKLAETFSKKETEIVEGLNEIDYSLNKTRLKASALSSEISRMEEKITQLKKNKDRTVKEISQGRHYADKRLTALYKMHMMGRMDLGLMPSSIFDFFVHQNAMKRVVEADYETIARQNNDVKAIEKLEGETEKEIQIKMRLEAELNEQIRIKQAETQKKELILKEIRQKKELSLAAVESLKLAAAQLDGKIEKIQPVRIKKTENGSFYDHQGRLMIPVEGEIISQFGNSSSGAYNIFTFQKGIDIKAKRGEPVKSVFRGEVMFAQWLKGYGNVLIINHGDSYYTLYAHVEEMFKKEGEMVETGDVIATAGDTGSIKGTCLHFEVRYHGKPLDPMKWLRKGA